jgi:hypothetical protein
MAFKLRHPFSGHIYTALADELVEVDTGSQTGVFDRYGTWISGSVRAADAEMCRWVGTHDRAVSSRHSAGFSRSHASTPEGDMS